MQILVPTRFYFSQVIFYFVQESTWIFFSTYAIFFRDFLLAKKKTSLIFSICFFFHKSFRDFRDFWAIFFSRARYLKIFKKKK